LPGVPENTVQLRIDAALQPDWRLAANLLYRSAIYARGDDNNQDSNGKIAGYTVVNLDTTYTVNRHLQVFARVDNVFNREYATSGVLGQNFFNGPGHTFDGNNASNEQFVGAGAPRGVWVGLRYSWQ
jgi:outer membrane receptor protein involved in Fe transport